MSGAGSGGLTTKDQRRTGAARTRLPRIATAMGHSRAAHATGARRFIARVTTCAAREACRVLS